MSVRLAGSGTALLLVTENAVAMIPCSVPLEADAP